MCLEHKTVANLVLQVPEKSVCAPIQYFYNRDDANTHRQSHGTSHLRQKFKRRHSISHEIFGNPIFTEKDVDDSDILFIRLVGWMFQF